MLDESADELRARLAASPPAMVSRNHAIEWIPHQLHTCVTDAIAHLPSDVYQRGDSLVRVMGGRIVRLGESTLAAELTRSIEFVQTRIRGKRAVCEPIGPPDRVVRAIIGLGHWPSVPRLIGVVTAPVLRPDGSVVDVAGYDPTTELYYAPGREYPPHPAAPPSLADARAAADELLDVVREFPLRADLDSPADARNADRAAWLALVLTLVGRDLIDGPVPAFEIDGNTPGCGKVLLAKIAWSIATGERLAVTPTPPRDQEATAKLITSIIESGDRILAIDNVVGSWGGAVWDALLTSTSWTARPVGARDRITLPWRAVIVVTGNGLGLDGDTARRVLPIRLRSSEPDPEARTGFRHVSIETWAREHHPHLHALALTILRYAITCPDAATGPRTWGSYEGWSALVRRAVLAATGIDPLDTRESITESDDTIEMLAGLIMALRRRGKPETATELHDAAWLPTGAVRESDLAAALRAVTGVEHPTTRMIGRRLKPHVGRVVEIDGGQFVIARSVDAVSRVARWGVSVRRNPTPSTAAPTDAAEAPQASPEMIA